MAASADGALRVGALASPIGFRADRPSPGVTLNLSGRRGSRFIVAASGADARWSEGVQDFADAFGESRKRRRDLLVSHT